MGRFGDGWFADDLALDVRAGFRSAVASGRPASEVAGALLETPLAVEILTEFPREDWDDGFFEEAAGLIFAVVVLQLEHDALRPDAAELAHLAIASERRVGAPAERIAMLADLERRLPDLAG